MTREYCSIFSTEAIISLKRLVAKGLINQNIHRFFFQLAYRASVKLTLFNHHQFLSYFFFFFFFERFRELETFLERPLVSKILKIVVKLSETAAEQ